MKQRKFLSDIAIYTLFGAIEKVIPFLILPYLTRLFSVEEVGYYTLYHTIIVLLIPIITLEVTTTISVNFFHYDKAKFSRSLYNGFVACLFCFITAIFILIFAGTRIAQFIHFPYRELWWSLLTIPFIFINDNLQIIYRNQNRPVAFGIFSSFRSIVSYGLGFILIFTTTLTWNAFVLSYLLGNLAFAFWSFYSLLKNNYINFVLDKSLLVENIRVGYPISLHMIGTWMSNSINQFLVNICIGITATGMYGVGSTFGMIMSFIQTSLNKAYMPMLFNNIKKEEYISNTKMIRLLYFLIISSTILVVLCGYFGVGIMFGDKYIATRSLIFPLVLTASVQGLYKIHSAFLFYYKKTMAITKITFTLGILNVPLAYVMLTEYGVSGAAYSSLIIWALSYLLVYIESKKVYNY